MNLIPTDEHEAFRRAVRAFIEAKSPPAEVRRLMDTPTGYDPEIWRQLSDQLALPGIAIPEEYGGGGSGWTESAIVMEEMGRALFPSPYLATAVSATAALLESRFDEAAGALLSRIASGNVTVAVALPQPGSHDGEPTLSARRTTAGWTVDGHADFVIDGATADVLLLPATTSEGVRLLSVEASAAGLQRLPLTTLDRTRRQARIELDATPAQPIGNSDTAEHALARAADLTAVAIAAEQLGGAARCLEAAVSYAGFRHQFGRPIGSFQAVKHMCANMLVDVESARSTVAYAAWVADHEPASLPVAASLAKACASDAFSRASAHNIQIHGGIGFTWEHDAHLYYRRARSTALLFGDSQWHRGRLARSLGMG